MQQVNQRERTRIEKLIKSIPKAEIHLHLEGVASVDTLWRLIKLHKLKVDGVSSRKDLVERFKIKSLDEFIWLFINILQNAFRNAEDLELLIDDLQKYLLRNTITYAEIFFAPSKFLQNGLDFAQMMGILERGAARLKREAGLEIKFIIDVSRSYGLENAQKNLELTLAHLNNSIIGIGLGGSESQGPAEEFTSVFEKARKAGLQVVAHAGEDVDSRSIWNTLKFLKASRIGHGISAIEDEKLMKLLKEKRIPLEICPTSNIFTQKYVKSLEAHPIRPFYDRGINVTLNTDDPTLFGIELIGEYYNLYEYLDFNLEELFQIMKNTVFASFMDNNAKELFWDNAAKVITAAGYVAP